MAPAAEAPARVALVGLGAVGTVVASRLLAAPGVDLAVVAGGRRRERLLAEPVTLNGRALALGEERVRAAPGAGWPDGADLAVVAVKTGALARAAEDLRPWLARGGRTVVLPLQNGIRSTETLETALGGGAAVVLRGLVLCNSAVRDGRDVRQNGTFRVRLGGPAEAAERAAGLLRRAGIDVDVPADIEAAQFEKWLLNVGLNQTEALLGMSHGKLLADPGATAFMRALIDEGVAVGRALGVAGVDGMPGRIREVLGLLSPDGKSSMLQDAEAGRETEVDAFAGELCRLAAAAGIEVPCNAIVRDAFGGRS